MRVDTLYAENFRNLRAGPLDFDEELTVIAGNNGQGKTNLLEAIFMLTGGKSFRGAKDAELVRHGEERAKVTGRCRAGGRQQEICVAAEGVASSARGRRASVNGVDYGRAAALAGIFTAVVFMPDHLNLVKGGPEGRRRFLDAALCQLYPGYVALLRRYMRALAQKNALLRRYRELNCAEAQLDVFDEELGKSGGEITRRRAEYLAGAAPAAARFYEELSRGAEKLEIRFAQSAPPGGLPQLLRARRANDIRSGFATCGPHREDFDVAFCGRSARLYGSQGQQRSAVLSLKLAEAERAGLVAKEEPVLLLDDVLSELDEGRQGYLLGRMGGRQSFVTCCDAAAFGRAAGRVLKLKDGALA